MEKLKGLSLWVLFILMGTVIALQLVLTHRLNRIEQVAVVLGKNQHALAAGLSKSVKTNDRLVNMVSSVINNRQGFIDGKQGE